MEESSLPLFHGVVLSQRLTALSEQFRLYNPPRTDVDADENEEQRFVENTTEMGIIETATPIHRDRFKHKSAAVLICLFEGAKHELRVILTKRSSRLSTHSGEVSLPGGKADDGDVNLIETATREAKEEIGLDPHLVNVVTVLEPFLSKHLLRVVPVIGMLTDKAAFKATPNPSEVESIFDAPLEMFLKGEGEKYLNHSFEYKSYVIWGLTAGILIRAAEVVYQRSPPQPLL